MARLGEIAFEKFMSVHERLKFLEGKDAAGAAGVVQGPRGSRGSGVAGGPRAGGGAPVVEKDTAMGSMIGRMSASAGLLPLTLYVRRIAT